MCLTPLFTYNMVAFNDWSLQKVPFMYFEYSNIINCYAFNINVCEYSSVKAGYVPENCQGVASKQSYIAMCSW